MWDPSTRRYRRPWWMQDPRRTIEGGCSSTGQTRRRRQLTGSNFRRTWPDFCGPGPTSWKEVGPCSLSAWAGPHWTLPTKVEPASSLGPTFRMLGMILSKRYKIQIIYTFLYYYLTYFFFFLFPSFLEFCMNLVWN